MADTGPQYLAAVILNLLSFVYGLTIGWTAPMQPLLELGPNGTMTNITGNPGFYVDSEDMSWIGGTFCIGGVLGTPLYGFLANALGRKKTLLLAVVPMIITFVLFLCAKSSMYLLVARVIGGIGGSATCVIVPMYIGEIAEDQIRGVLGSCFNLFICLGILTAFIVGSYTSYMFLAWFMIFCAVSFLILAMWLPETPVYCLIKERPGDAVNALSKLRGDNKELLQMELSNLATSVKEMKNTGGSMGLVDMFTDPATRKGLIIALTLMVVQQASGVSPIMNYTVAIFNASGDSKLPASMAAIIVGALQIVGALLGTALMDRAGRKILLLVSAVGMTVTLAPIAYFFYLLNSNADKELIKSISWIPIIALSVYIIVFALGFGPVPFVLIGEIFKTEARSLGTSLSVICVWFIAFFFLKFFATLSDAVGIHTCFALFSLCSAGGAVFTYFYVVETKGKPLDVILMELSGENIYNRSSVTCVEKENEKIQLENASNGTSHA